MKNWLLPVSSLSSSVVVQLLLACNQSGGSGVASPLHALSCLPRGVELTELSASFAKIPLLLTGVNAT